MSLDVKLISKNPVTKRGTGIFIRDNGLTKELSVCEAKELFPDALIQEMEYKDNVVFDGNITHNLWEMTGKAGIYDALWHPYKLHHEYNIPEGKHVEEMAFEARITIKAKDIIPFLEDGLSKLKESPEYFKQFNPPNGWGDYDLLVNFVDKYLTICKIYPEAKISINR